MMNRLWPLAGSRGRTPRGIEVHLEEVSDGNVKTWATARVSSMSVLMTWAVGCESLRVILPEHQMTSGPS